MTKPEPDGPNLRCLQRTFGAHYPSDVPSFSLATIRSEAKIDLLVTDVGLPNGMNGHQVADAARELRHGLKVLFVTGYAEIAIPSHGHLGPDMEVVTKPFQMEAVTERIRSLIEG